MNKNEEAATSADRKEETNKDEEAASSLGYSPNSNFSADRIEKTRLFKLFT